MSKVFTDYSGIENPIYTIHIILPKLFYHKARKGTVKKYSGSLVKKFPELGNLTDEELEKLAS
jgi:hypothetical protein